MISTCRECLLQRPDASSDGMAGMNGSQLLHCPGCGRQTRHFVGERAREQELEEGEWALVPALLPDHSFRGTTKLAKPTKPGAAVPAHEDELGDIFS